MVCQFLLDTHLLIKVFSLFGFQISQPRFQLFCIHFFLVQLKLQIIHIIRISVLSLFRFAILSNLIIVFWINLWRLLLFLRIIFITLLFSLFFNHFSLNTSLNSFLLVLLIFIVLSKVKFNLLLPQIGG